MSENIELIKLKNIFDFGNKVVVVGGAGYGKTTTLNYLFCNYEKIYELFPLKIKIDLKEYAEEISTNKCDILSCIAKQFNKKSKRSGASTEITEAFISNFLEQGKCLVIFDALDEIATQSARNTVRTEIANFCELYYLNRFIISTREVGYLKNKFDDSFIHLKINKFNLSQIKAYSKNWYKIHIGKKYNKAEFEQFWNDFLSESDKARCRELIENPIILILALVVFDIDQKLPNRRIKFYKKCIQTFLFEREDRKAAIELSKNVKNILSMDMVLPRVAHYKYQRTNESVSYKFTNSELKRSIFDAIEVSDIINWANDVDEYIKYLIERTELIGEIDEDVLDFAHKTFYEYFLALYFSLQLETNKLQRQLLKWIGDANNHELAQLIIEKIIESGDPFKQSEILEYLFNALSSKEKIEKRKEILFLLIELYGGNMMPPKYYELYYKSLLLNGSLFYSPKKRLLAKRRTDIKYDENELSNVYCQIVTETTTFQKTVESLLYLNHEFRKITLEKFYDKILLENTFKLFSYYSEPKRDLDEKECDNIKDVIYYFLNKRYDILQGSPLLLICLIELIYSYDLYNCIDYEKLLFLDIEPNEYFYNYSRGATLIALSNNSIENDHSFALLLLMLNVCSYKGANIIIGYALKTCRLNVENLPEIRSFIYWIWEVLNSSKDCQIFKNKIMEKGLYNEKYEMIYDQTYAAYQKSELDVTDYRIKDYIEANKKNI